MGAKVAAKRLVALLGFVLVLGGVAHSLDIWIAEAHLAGGALFLVGARKTDPLPWILGAALMVWTYAVPFLPILIYRAPPIFWVMPTLYSLASVAAVRWARIAAHAQSTSPPSGPASLEAERSAVEKSSGAPRSGD